MKRFLKRTLAVLMTVVMLLGIAPVAGLTNLLKASAATTYKTGDIVEFGSYPQSKVTDASLISALNSISGSTDNWTSYGYYSGTVDNYRDNLYNGQMTAKDFMRYKDIMYNGAKYRGVYFNEYRPKYTSYTTSYSYPNQEENGYYTGTTYWFRYEPLTWRVLDSSTGLILCENIIDSQAYNNYIIYSGSEFYGDASQKHYAGNYFYSSILHWLNNDFYNIAFTEVQKNNIEKTQLDNSCYRPDYPEQNAPSSNDKVFLLSYEDAINTHYGFDSDKYRDDIARLAKGTDYAKCQGLWVDFGKDYYGKSAWWLRTPSYSSRYACHVSNQGLVGSEKAVCAADYGVRPACVLSNLQSDTSMDDVENPENKIPDGMRIIINNTKLSYHVNDDVVLMVSDYKDDVSSCPQRLSVKVSDSGVLEVKNMFMYDDLPSFLHILDFEELHNCRFIHLKAKAEGTAGVSITNSDTGENRVIPISVTVDKVAAFRANNVKTYTYQGGFANHVVEEDVYNSHIDGLWVSDFNYKAATKNGVSGWNFSMNIYNENYCSGVVEVYDADGKLIEVQNVDRFEELTTGIFKTFKAMYLVIEDAFEGDSLSFRADARSKHTPITDLFVPQDGHIRVTCNSSISPSCAIANGIDLLFSGWSLAEDLSEIVVGKTNLTYDDSKTMKRTAFGKLLLQEEYLKFAEKFRDKVVEKAKESLTPQMINSFVSDLTVDVDALFKDMGFSLDGMLKTAFNTGVGIAEDVFKKCTGSAGLTLRGLFLFVDVEDYIEHVRDVGATANGNNPFGCYTPVKSSTSGILKNENVKVNTNNKVPSETVLQSYKIMKQPDVITVILNEEYQEREDVGEYELYEIALMNNGKEIQPNGTVTVWIDSPYEKAQVARQNADGTWEVIYSKMENGMIRFDVDHFCKFAIFENLISRVISVGLEDIGLNLNTSTKITPNIKADAGAIYTIKYASSNQKVATVDQNGNVYSTGIGESTITCTVTDSNGNVVSGTCKVYVDKSKLEDVVFSMEKESETDSQITIILNLEKGSFNALDLGFNTTGLKCKKIILSSELKDFETTNKPNIIISSNPSTGKFSMGSLVLYSLHCNFLKVVFEKISKEYSIEGSVSSCAKSFNNKTLKINGYVSNKISSVATPVNIVRSVSIPDKTINYKKSATLNPTITADDGVKYTVKYESSNPKVATVDQNGNVYGAKKGSADIKVTVTDSAGNTVTDTCNVKVKYSFGQWLIVILLFGWIWY